MNDDDWDVYRGISKNYTNSDDENLEMKLQELDLELREIGFLLLRQYFNF